MNYKIIQLTIFLFVLFLSVCVSSAIAISKTAKVTIKVIGENNQPIIGADVGVGFEYDGSMGSKLRSKRGLSDLDGFFSASDKTNGHIGFRVTKDGYYKSTGSFNYGKFGTMHWKPWNPELSIVLRKIENPIPMYARSSGMSGVDIPIANLEVGFDLSAFDWVAPYGKGILSDFLFFLTMIDNGGDDFEYHLKITFSNDFDGIQKLEQNLQYGSVFKLPRLAPVDGYRNSLDIDFKGLKRGAKFTWSRNHHYIFRVRSEKDGDKLKKAMYGKILGDIKILSSKQKGDMPKVRFLYFLNPDYTRNLEFDPEQNLFRNLSDLEEVGIK